MLQRNSWRKEATHKTSSDKTQTPATVGVLTSNPTKRLKNSERNGTTMGNAAFLLADLACGINEVDIIWKCSYSLGT